MSVHRLIVATAATAVLASCATPPEVHELAEKASANVGIVGARLAQLAEESNRLYAGRTDAIVQLREANARVRASYAYDVALTKKVGEARDLELIKDMEAWVKEVDAIFASAADEAKGRREALLGAQSKIDTNARALQNVAEILSALAKEESTAERAQALRKFSSEVREHMKQELESGSDTAKSAKALLDQVRDAFADAPGK